MAEVAQIEKPAGTLEPDNVESEGADGADQHTPAEQIKEEALESESKVADGSAAPVTTNPEEAHASDPAATVDTSHEQNSPITTSTATPNGADDNASMIPLGKGVNIAPPLGTDTADVSGAATPAVAGNDSSSVKTTDTSRADIDATKQAIVQAVINCKLSREIVFASTDNDVGNEDGREEVKRVLSGYKGIEAALAEMNRDIPVHIRDSHDLGYAESERLKQQDKSVTPAGTSENHIDGDAKQGDPTDTAVTSSAAGAHGINGTSELAEDENEPKGITLGADALGATGAAALSTHKGDNDNTLKDDTTTGDVVASTTEDEGALPSSSVDKGKGRAIEEDTPAAPVSPSKPPQGERLFDKLKREVEERARRGQLGQFNKPSGSSTTAGQAASTPSGGAGSKPSVDTAKANDTTPSVADAEAGNQAKAVSTPSAFTEEFGANETGLGAGSPTTPTSTYNSPTSRARTASMSSQTTTGKQGGLLGGLFRRRSKRQSLSDGPTFAGGRRASQDLGRTVSRDNASAIPTSAAHSVAEPREHTTPAKSDVPASSAGVGAGAATAAAAATAIGSASDSSKPEEKSNATEEEPSANAVTIAEDSELSSSRKEGTGTVTEQGVLPLNETSPEAVKVNAEDEDKGNDSELLPETQKLAPLATVAADEPAFVANTSTNAINIPEDAAPAAQSAPLAKEQPAAPPATPAHVASDDDKPLYSGSSLERTPSKGGFLGLFRRRSSRRSSGEVKRSTSDIGKPMPIVTTTNSNASAAAPITTRLVREEDEPAHGAHKTNAQEEEALAADTTIIDHDASEHADFHTEPHSPRDLDELETVQEELERGPDETVGEPDGAASDAKYLDGDDRQHDDTGAVSDPVEHHEADGRSTSAPLASPVGSHGDRATSPRVAMTPAERLLDHGKGEKGEKRKSSGGFFGLFRSRTINNKERPPSYTPNPDITNAVANVGIVPRQKSDRHVEKRDVAVGTDDLDGNLGDEHPVEAIEPEEEIPDDRSITEIAASTPLPAAVYTEKTRAKHERLRKKREHEEAIERERIRRENDILNKRERILNAYTGKQDFSKVPKPIRTKGFGKSHDRKELDGVQFINKSDKKAAKQEDLQRTNSRGSSINEPSSPSHPASGGLAGSFPLEKYTSAASQGTHATAGRDVEPASPSSPTSKVTRRLSSAAHKREKSAETPTQMQTTTT